MKDGIGVQPGYRLIEFASLGSTNEEALQRGRAGDPGRLWIRADVQLQGRGRLGRAWSSPIGNLYSSLLLIDPAEPRLAPQIGFVAGMALARAVRRFAADPDDVRIKWPNDLVHGRAKLAGILVEGSQGADGRFAAVIGCGVNCASNPRGLDYPTARLNDLAPQSVDPRALLAALAAEMAQALDLWARGTGFAQVRDQWLKLAIPPGAALTARAGAEHIDGFFETIDQQARLVLQTDRGTRTVDAADVFLAPATPPAATR